MDMLPTRDDSECVDGQYVCPFGCGHHEEWASGQPAISHEGFLIVTANRYYRATEDANARLGKMPACGRQT